MPDLVDVFQFIFFLSLFSTDIYISLIRQEHDMYFEFFGMMRRNKKEVVLDSIKLCAETIKLI